VQTPAAVLGLQSSGIGQLNVWGLDPMSGTLQGQGTSNAASLVVGGNGQGAMVISAGGTVTSTIRSIGDKIGASGTVTVVAVDTTGVAVLGGIATWALSISSASEQSDLLDTRWHRSRWHCCAW